MNSETALTVLNWRHLRIENRLKTQSWSQKWGHFTNSSLTYPISAPLVVLYNVGFVISVLPCHGHTVPLTALSPPRSSSLELSNLDQVELGTVRWPEGPTSPKNVPLDLKPISPMAHYAEFKCPLFPNPNSTKNIHSVYLVKFKQGFPQVKDMVNRDGCFSWQGCKILHDTSSHRAPTTPECVFSEQWVFVFRITGHWTNGLSVQ